VFTVTSTIVTPAQSPPIGAPVPTKVYAVQAQVVQPPTAQPIQIQPQTSGRTIYAQQPQIIAHITPGQPPNSSPQLSQIPGQENFAPLTTANLIRYDNESAVSRYDSKPNPPAGSFYAESVSQPSPAAQRSRDYSITQPLQFVVDSLSQFSDNVTKMKVDFSENVAKMRSEKKKMEDFQIKDVYPRMPWHDVHACVVGLPVRDLAAHFVQVSPFVLAYASH
jgi:hypothetical protein